MSKAVDFRFFFERWIGRTGNGGASEAPQDERGAW
jgi:hypothetical protein